MASEKLELENQAKKGKNYLLPVAPLDADPRHIYRTPPRTQWSEPFATKDGMAVKLVALVY